ncbi:MAG: DUF6090 family protein [Balneolaceae bacterium]
MLRFFRTIRKKLMEHPSKGRTRNKVRTYLLYAIGEILLVVIGILIALQINNWNENKVERKQELKILEQINADLEENNNNIEFIVEALTGIDQSIDSVLTSLEQKKVISYFSVYVSMIHRKVFFNNSISGYSLLSNSFGTIIQNDSLRNSIVLLYESDFTNILERQKIMFDIHEQHLYPQSHRLFTINQNVQINAPWLDDVSYNPYIPINFDELTENIEYINTIKNLKKVLYLRLTYLERTQERIKNVKATLNSEVNKFN